MSLDSLQYRMQLDKDFHDVHRHFPYAPEIEKTAWYQTLEGIKSERQGSLKLAQWYYCQCFTDVAKKRFDIINKILLQRNALSSELHSRPNQFNFMPSSNSVSIHIGVHPTSYVPGTYIPTPTSYRHNFTAYPTIQAPASLPMPGQIVRYESRERTTANLELTPVAKEILIALYREHHLVSSEIKMLTRIKFCEKYNFQIHYLRENLKTLTKMGLINYLKNKKGLPTLTLHGKEKAKKLYNKEPISLAENDNDPHLTQPPRTLVFRTTQRVPTPLQAPVVHAEPKEPKKNMMKLSSILN